MKWTSFANWKWYVFVLILMAYCFWPNTSQAGNSWDGVVVSVTDTQVSKTQPDANQYIAAGTGAAVGYGAGRLAGTLVGSKYSSSLGWIGAGLGAITGSAIASSNSAIAIVVKYPNNQKQTIIQNRDKFPNTTYAPGDKVTVVNLNGEYLVVK